MRDIRIIQSCDIEFDKGVTVFVGDNGQGKTSILESIYWTSHAKSFRHVNVEDIIRKNCDSAKINIEITDDLRPQDIDITLNRIGRDNVLVNGQKLRKNSDLLDTLRVSIFTPDDLDIIKGSSALRREVLDDNLFQISKKYIAASKDYSRSLKQKNAYLKSDDFDKVVIEVLNNSLVVSGSVIIKSRLAALNNFRKVLQDAYDHISGENSQILIRYISKIFSNDHGEDKDPNEDISNEELQAVFLSKIEEYSSIEYRRGHSIIGPHRDDLAIFIHGRDSRTQASQGEQRSMALALKMAFHRLVTQKTGDNPILLLDDVFSELDLGRTHRLVECLPAAQTFVTTATDIPVSLKVRETFNVSAGVVTKSKIS